MSITSKYIHAISNYNGRVAISCWWSFSRKLCKGIIESMDRYSSSFFFKCLFLNLCIAFIKTRICIFNQKWVSHSYWGGRLKFYNSFINLHCTQWLKFCPWFFCFLLIRWNWILWILLLLIKCEITSLSVHTFCWGCIKLFFFFNRWARWIPILIVMFDRWINFFKKTKPFLIDNIKNMHIIKFFSDFINASINYHKFIFIQLRSMPTSC